MAIHRRQLTIIHLTDIHFGKDHRFDPARAPDGSLASRVGVPKLYQSILKDLASRKPEERAYFTGAATAGAGTPDVRTIFALTGDFTQTGERDEYIEAEEMIDEFLKQKVFGWEIRPQDIFMVPGNHDPQYAENRTEVRWTEYCRFFERHTDAVAAATSTPPPRFRPEHPEKLSRLINQAGEGLIVAEVNSSAYVKKGTPDEVRGQIDGDVAPNLRRELEAIDGKLRAEAIKIALVHHHPVVMPQLAEANRGYDGILNVSPLLTLLKNNDFLLLMHGHKHNPTVFTYDPENAWARDRIMPILLVAGGSAGSSGLPPPGTNTNTYNIIDLKWYPETRQARIHVETRGLVQTDRDGNPASPADWYWQTLRSHDRVLSPPLDPPASKGITRPKVAATDGPFDAQRAAILKSSRRNFPAVEVLPSFNPQQNFEARVWVEAQKDSPDYELPDKVEWSAAMNFTHVVTCPGSADTDFGARFTYHAPMLIQCRLFWKDITDPVVAYIFAHQGKRGSVAQQ